MPSVRISPGRLTALWTVIRTLEKLGGEAPISEILRVASRTSLRAGGLPIRDGLALAFEGSFLERGYEDAVLTRLGREALHLEPEDEPGPELRRMFLSVLLLRDPPVWVAFWQGDPEALPLVIPEGERRLLEELGLYPEEDTNSLEARAWWAALRRVPLPEEAAAFRRAIGDAGEQLTLAYERRRLDAEGFQALARDVRWVAQESPAYGFDVLSFCGLAGGGDPEDRLAIEVKSMSRVAPVSFSFFLTVHEWETAVELGDAYLMHFWDGVDPGPPPAAPGDSPRITSPSILANHLPNSTSCDGECAWQSASIVLPLADIE
jgi:hypothetical protein